MIMVSKALLDHNPDPSRAEIVDALAGNYCRCTGYEPIIQAVHASAQRMKAE
jgi:carbon-monoxide dehydrogenase small subunit